MNGNTSNRYTARTLRKPCHQKSKWLKLEKRWLKTFKKEEKTNKLKSCYFLTFDQVKKDFKFESKPIGHFNGKEKLKATYFDAFVFSDQVLKIYGVSIANPFPPEEITQTLLFRKERLTCWQSIKEKTTYQRATKRYIQCTDNDNHWSVNFDGIWNSL